MINVTEKLGFLYVAYALLQISFLVDYFVLNTGVSKYNYSNLQKA